VNGTSKPNGTDTAGEKKEEVKEDGAAAEVEPAKAEEMEVDA
jgi:hypothetical protein